MESLLCGESIKNDEREWIGVCVQTLRPDEWLLEFDVWLMFWPTRRWLESEPETVSSSRVGQGRLEMMWETMAVETGMPLAPL